MKIYTYIQTNAKNSELAEEVLVDSMHYGIPGDEKIKARKLKLAAQPVDGAANKELIKLIAKEFNVPKSSLQIVKGEKSKYKVVAICDYKDKNSRT